MCNDIVNIVVGYAKTWQLLPWINPDKLDWDFLY